MHRFPGRAVAALFALVALTLTACDAAGGAAGPDPAADGDWIMVSGHGPDGEIDVVSGHEPTLTVNGFEVSGHGGCNHFGTASAEGEEDQQPDQWPTEFVSTMMACDPPEVMDQESQFLTAMRQIQDVQADGDELVLTGPDTELRFERV